MTTVSDTLPDRMTDCEWSVFDNAQFFYDSAPGENVVTFRPGQQIHGTPWIVVKSLGKGGVGEVFEVEHERLGRRAAFKVLHQDNLFRRGLAERAANEGRLLASVRHANIVDVYDMDVLADGRPFVVLELLEGSDLRAALKRVGVLSVPAALDIVTQVLQGLSALHGAGIVHRDIKLENLFLCESGHVEILDLGAAERIGEEVGERSPSLGTPRTMAPEQYEGKKVDGRADLYALGIVLYELLAGRGPFDDVSGLEALRFAHCHRPAPPPSRFAPQHVPPDVDALVLRALAKSPNERFVSADAMLAEMAALRAAPKTAAHSMQDAHVRELHLTSVTVPSVWAIDERWSMFRFMSLLRPLMSPERLLSMAMLALVIASVTLGIALGQHLPRLDDAVQLSVP